MSTHQPKEIFVSNETYNGSISYLYDAEGNKLQKQVMDQQTQATTDYLGAFQYQDGALDFIAHAEGYVKAVHTGETTEYHYVYNYTDHTSTTLSTGLGNIRLSYGRDPETNEVAILKENHYYPFGLKHKDYVSEHKIFNPIARIGKVALVPVRNYLEDTYRYDFNAKEHQPELGLNWHDYHARNYDAALGRWMNVDPLADQAPGWTPYRYGFNNPVRYIDPDGRLETNYEDEFGNLLVETNDGNDATVIIPNENVEDFLEDFESTHFMQRDGSATNSNWISKYGVGMMAEEGAQIQP